MDSRCFGAEWLEQAVYLCRGGEIVGRGVRWPTKLVIYNRLFVCVNKNVHLPAHPLHMPTHPTCTTTTLGPAVVIREVTWSGVKRIATATAAPCKKLIRVGASILLIHIFFSPHSAELFARIYSSRRHVPFSGNGIYWPDTNTTYI